MMTRYVFTFARIGKSRDLELTVDTDDISTLPALVLRFALQHLGSRNVDVVIDLDAGTGYLEAGWRSVGNFTVTEQPAPAGVVATTPRAIPRPMAPLGPLSDKTWDLLDDVAAGRVYALTGGSPDIWMVGATRAGWQQVRALVRRGLVERTRATDMHDDVRLSPAGRDEYHRRAS